MNTTGRAPASFISHGAPTFALEPGELGPQLNTLGEHLEGVRSIMVVSPHWMSEAVEVMTSAQPGTLHDFGGFPAPLYALKYAAPGDPEMAAMAIDLLKEQGFAAGPNDRRARDHGAWVPMLHLRPEADLPVFQVSLPVRMGTEGALSLGRALAPLRAHGVMIVGSGSLTHNLYELGALTADSVEYARTFTAWVRDALAREDEDALLDYRQQAPDAARAHPTEEHFLPLLVAFGARDAADHFSVIPGGYTYGALSMESYLWRL